MNCTQRLSILGRRIVNKKTFYIFLALSAAVSSGCFIYNPTAEFVSQRYTNAVAYFNTFYNAQRAFDEAEDELFKARKEYNDKGTTERPFTVPPSARTKFTTSIEKNSKLLSYYPTSKWVDDALLMIGKAYFYIEDYVKAERKFLELMAKFPESEFINEANLLLGLSYLQQKKFDQGVKLLHDLISSTQEVDEEIAGKACFELGKYYFGLRNYEQAQKYYIQSLLLLNDDTQKAQTQFQIALCYDNLKLYSNAEVEYAKVGDFETEYNLLFRAELARIKTIVQQQRYNEALEALSLMLKDTKNAEFYASVHFEIANTLFKHGRLDEAMEKYQYIDTAYAKTDEAARSYFSLAKIYEDTLKNYDSARVYYNKAKSEFSASKITAEAAMKAEIFNKYDNLKKDLARFDSLLLSAMNLAIDDTPLRTSLSDSIGDQDSAVAITDDTPQRKATKPGKKLEAKNDSLSTVDSSKIKARIAKELAKKQLIDSLQRSLARTKFEIGGLFFLELQIADSAMYWLLDVARNYPESELTPRVLFTIAEIYRTLRPNSNAERDSIYHIIITKFSASAYAQEARRNLGLPVVTPEPDSAFLLYTKAEELLDANNINGAINIYQEIAEKYSASPLSPKALYATGWLLENHLVNNDSAVAVYKKLISKYPTSTFASAVRVKVTEYNNELKRLEEEAKKKQLEEQKQNEQQEKVKKEKEQTGLKQELQQVKKDSVSLPQK